MIFSIKKWFTLIEIIVVTIMISVWFITIYNVLSSWYSTLNRVRQEVIAINIAREWMEMVYNLRNSNRIRWSWKKDECWLKIDPLVDEDGDWCENDDWLGVHNYIPEYNTITDQKYVVMIDKWTDDMNLKDNYMHSWDRDFLMCKNWDDWFNCNWDYTHNYIKEWRFFRIIEWKWLYNKENWSSLSCNNWSDLSCWDDRAKEYRFCSRVEYLWSQIWHVEFCGVLTNFNWEL